MVESLKISIYGENNPKARILNKEYAADIRFENIKPI
jgi:hypothetical protein